MESKYLGVASTTGGGWLFEDLQGPKLLVVYPSVRKSGSGWTAPGLANYQKFSMTVPALNGKKSSADIVNLRRLAS